MLAPRALAGGSEMTDQELKRELKVLRHQIVCLRGACLLFLSVLSRGRDAKIRDLNAAARALEEMSSTAQGESANP